LRGFRVKREVEVEAETREGLDRSRRGGRAAAAQKGEERRCTEKSEKDWWTTHGGRATCGTRGGLGADEGGRPRGRHEDTDEGAAVAILTGMAVEISIGTTVISIGTVAAILTGTAAAISIGTTVISTGTAADRRRSGFEIEGAEE
jgi:hypothetical protein